jgi:hypothetical protein
MASKSWTGTWASRGLEKAVLCVRPRPGDSALTGHSREGEERPCRR